MRFDPTGTRRAIKITGIAILALVAVVWLHRAFATVPVVVNGETVYARRGARVGDVVGSLAPARPGRVLSAADHRVLSNDGGMPGRVLVNHSAEPMSAEVRRYDSIRVVQGADVVEPVVEETRVVTPEPVHTIGSGPVTKTVIRGRDGVAVVRVGVLSGEVVATETVLPALPAVVRRVAAAGTGVVSLTFDDGPWPRQTLAVLAILKQKNVPATFFVVGEQVTAHPNLARAVVEAGHALGNHSYTHTYLDKSGPGRARWEIEATNRAILKATGVKPHWVRAPGGLLAPQVHAVFMQTGMRSALWTVDPQDWRDNSTSTQLARSVIAAVRPGSVVILHDGGGDQSATIAALPAIIDGIRARGLQFVTLDEMSGVKGAW